jgi:pilus assembly protein CpaE
MIIAPAARLPTVLLACDDPDLRGRIAQYLGRIDDLRLLRSVAANDLPRTLERLQVDVLLLVVGSPREADSRWTSLLRRPQAPATVLVGEPSLEGYRLALRLGAQDLVPKDAPPPDLAEAIYRAAAALGERPTPTRTGQVVSVFGLRGGVGKTCLAVNLAVAASRRLPRGSVALVDANLQLGSLDHILNVRPRRPLTDLASEADRLDGEGLRTFLTPYPPAGLEVLPAPEVPEAAEYLTPSHFERVVEVARETYSLTVVDTSSTLAELDFAVAARADAVLLLVTPDLPAVRAAQVALRLFERLEVDRARVRLVLSAWTEAAMPAAEVGRVLEVPVWEVIPFDRGQALRTLNEGRPAALHGLGSPMGRAVERLTQRLVGAAPRGRRR